MMSGMASMMAWMAAVSLLGWALIAGVVAVVIYALVRLTSSSSGTDEDRHRATGTKP
jgi:hypothetical protein